MTGSTERAVLAGGCFWGVQDLLRRYPGVISTRVGYSGGEVPNATYRNHGNHAEAVEIIFDPKIISFRKLLEFFFQIHDPSTREPPGQRPRRQLPLGDLLHQRRAEAGRARHHRRCRCFRALAGQGGHRGDRRRAVLGSRARASGLSGKIPRWLHLPLRPAGLDAAAPRGQAGRRGVSKGSDLLVAALENEGVEYIFAIPGEENLDVLESLRRSKIKLVLTRHEQAAGFMAATYGRLTGRAGVCLATLGPGAQPGHGRRLCPARRHADGDDNGPEADQEQPAGALPDRRHRRDHAAPHQDGARRSSPRRRFRPWCATRSGSRSRSGRAPCISNCPRTSRPTKRQPTLIPSHPGRASGGARRGDRARRRHDMAARRPLVMMGAAASRPQLAEPLSGFVRRWDSVLQHPDGQGRRQAGVQSLYRHRRAVGARRVHEAIDRADLIISIGHDTVEKPPFLMGHGGTAGHPCRRHAGHGGAGLLPASRDRR